MVFYLYFKILNETIVLSVKILFKYANKKDSLFFFLLFNFSLFLIKAIYYLFF